MLPLKDTSNSKKFPLWVVIIILINVYVFYLELTSPNPDAFIYQWSLVPARINFSDLSTLITFITSQFLHGGFLHIITNMWFLWIFGDNIEGRVGDFIFPIFYLASGLVGNLLQYFFIPSSMIATLGASGAIAGILGAYFALYPRNKVKTLIFILFFVTIIDIPAYWILFYWFILQLLSSAVSVAGTNIDSGGIAYFAHIGGFTLGWLAGKFLF